MSEGMKGALSPDLWIEFIISLFAALIAAATPWLFRAPVDLAAIASLFFVATGTFIVSVKFTQRQFMHELAQQLMPQRLMEQANLLGALDPPRRAFAEKLTSEYMHRLRSIASGRVTLDEADYYERIINCMNAMPAGATVTAVNSISARRWTDDPRQRVYKSANERAVAREVRIERCHIVSADQLANESLVATIVSDSLQTTFHLVEAGAIKSRPELAEDWVYFGAPLNELYLGYADSLDEPRVAKAELILDQTLIDDYLARFSKLRSFRRP